MHGIEFSITFITAQHDHAAVPAGVNAQAIQQQSVVAAVDAGLHEHEVVDAELCGLGFDLYQWPMRGVVVPWLYERCGIEDMHMAIPATTALTHTLIHV